MLGQCPSRTQQLGGTTRQDGWQGAFTLRKLCSTPFLTVACHQSPATLALHTSN